MPTSQQSELNCDDLFALPQDAEAAAAEQDAAPLEAAAPAAAEPPADGGQPLVQELAMEVDHPAEQQPLPPHAGAPADSDGLMMQMDTDSVPAAEAAAPADAMDQSDAVPAAAMGGEGSDDDGSATEDEARVFGSATGPVPPFESSSSSSEDDSASDSSASDEDDDDDEEEEEEDDNGEEDADAQHADGVPLLESNHPGLTSDQPMDVDDPIPAASAAAATIALPDAAQATVAEQAVAPLLLPSAETATLTLLPAATSFLAPRLQSNKKNNKKRKKERKKRRNRKKERRKKEKERKKKKERNHTN
jgi:translation initiation factor IF-2